MAVWRPNERIRTKALPTVSWANRNPFSANCLRRSRRGSEAISWPQKAAFKDSGRRERMGIFKRIRMRISNKWVGCRMLRMSSAAPQCCHASKHLIKLKPMRHPPHCWRLCPATLDIGQWTLDFGHRSEGGCAAGGGGQHSRSFGAGDVCNFGFLPQLSAFSFQLDTSSPSPPRMNLNEGSAGPKQVRESCAYFSGAQLSSSLFYAATSSYAVSLSVDRTCIPQG